MNFHTFGQKNKPLMVLIHGMLTPWQIWQEVADYFSDRYYICIIALDAHEEDYKSEFISIGQEAKKIEDYLKNEGYNKISALCGISMGGVISFELLKRNNIEICSIVLDGAPLTGFGKLAGFVMKSQYKSLIHKSQLREKGVIASFKNNFLPEKYLESYLRITDRMSDSSINNIINSLSQNRLTDYSEMQNTEILFTYGTKGNESISKKSAYKLKTKHSDLLLHCFDGCAHCRYISFEPDKWIKTISQFLTQNQDI